MCETETVKSCDSCRRLDCSISFASLGRVSTTGITSFVLDEVWPEFARFLGAVRAPEDQVLAPGTAGRNLLPRYDWPGRVTRPATLATLQRHRAMRAVANQTGKVRQQAYLEHDRKIAEALAARIDFRARHLVVAQTLLPFLQRLGALGGRTYDVILTRYPLADLHARLDRQSEAQDDSRTLADFRAPDDLVADEAAALAGARRLVTPHWGIAALFPGRTSRLDWVMPTARPRQRGDRVAFLGPTIGRQGAFQVREIARTLDKPLIVFGADLEGRDFWSGIAIERRSFGPDWLDGIGAILHPSVATNQPRRLLDAAASGVMIYGNDGAGLAPGFWQPIEAFRAPIIA